MSAASLRADEVKSLGVDPGAAPGSPGGPGVPLVLSPPLPPPPVAPGGGDVWTRSRLTGDWGGTRTELADHGVTFFGDVTQYYQGVAAGGVEQQFKYGGRGDYLLDLDSRKLGLWDGGRLDLRAETRLGQDANGIDGVVAPSNFAMAMPRSNKDVTALTGVQYTQNLSENVAVLIGKLNLLDGTPGTYVKGMRLNYFWNSAMQNDLSRVYLLPSALGAGLAVRDGGEPVFNVYLLDTRYTPTSDGLSSLFSNGVLLYSEYRVRTNWFGLPGHSTGGLLYSTATRGLLDLNPFLQIQAVQLGTPPGKKSSSWTVSYRFDQVLYADPDAPTRTWTLSGAAGFSDGNPNPIRWFANLSVVGGSPIRGRGNDAVGVGYYHVGITSAPVAKTLGFGPEDGVEVFYNAAVTPWFHVTPDLQIIEPAQRSNRTAILVGVRARVSF